ncbi:MAG: DUF4442 domain-containing protein [Bacteroidota bacterium]
MTKLSQTTDLFDPKAPAIQKRLELLKSPMKMRLFYLQRLPTLWWWGVTVVDCSPYSVQVKLPYGWRTQNPFQSIYFAAQLGAAELSTGIIGMLATLGRGRISMLVTKIESEFVKKANTDTIFRCDDGQKIIDAVQEALDTGEGRIVRSMSVGTQQSGEVVSRVYVTWSFKKKSSR